LNFESQYLAALDALIVALGGVVPVATVPNYQAAVLLRLVAIVQAVGGVLPLPQGNYHAAALAHWRAAIAARGGVVPTVFVNYSQALLLHVQAFQATRGISVVLSGRNFEQNLLALLSAVPPYDADAAAYIAAVEAADGQPLETGVKLAYDTFFRGTKTDGDFAKLKAACILAGARTLAGALLPLVATMPSPTNIGFVVGDRSRSGGFKGNGLNKSLTVPLSSTSLGQNNRSLGVWVSESGTGIEWYIGNGNAESGVDRIARTGGIVYYNASANGNTANYTTAASGFFGTSRNSSTTIDVATSADNKSVAVTSQSTLSTANYNLFFNSASYSDHRTLFFWIGDAVGLTNMRSRLNTLAAALATL
jgi:hypothetical protein